MSDIVKVGFEVLKFIIELAYFAGQASTKPRRKVIDRDGNIIRYE